MERVARDKVLMQMAAVASQRATCSRLQVGVVFSRDGRVVATGYNGAPAGMAHCDHTCSCKADELSELDVDHLFWCDSLSPCYTAEHAEKNAIAFAARHGVALDRTEMHVTHMPCHSCAMSVINAGIIRVVYHLPYRKTEGVELLARGGVEVVELQ